MILFIVAKHFHKGEDLRSVEICVNCGKIAKNPGEDFHCVECGSNVAVVVPIAMFKQLVRSGAAKG